MNADAIRHLYAYHFAENRKTWDTGVMALTDEAFTRDSDYSHGSVREQVVHLVDVDEAWFSDLGALAPSDAPPTDDRAAIRQRWDAIEAGMHRYLDGLTDDMLPGTPLQGEDAELRLWQVLIHVVNHGTDHRAQLLRLLSDLGVETESQDYVFFAYDHPLP